nr:predicted protein [Ipomoea batatas]
MDPSALFREAFVACEHSSSNNNGGFIFNIVSYSQKIDRSQADAFSDMFGKREEADCFGNETCEFKPAASPVLRLRSLEPLPVGLPVHRKAINATFWATSSEYCPSRRLSRTRWTLRLIAKYGLAHSTRLCCPDGLFLSIALRPDSISRRTTPKLYTSLLQSEEKRAPWQLQEQPSTAKSRTEAGTITRPVPGLVAENEFSSIQPLKTEPNPPSPSTLSGRKFLVATLRSAKLKLFKVVDFKISPSLRGAGGTAFLLPDLFRLAPSVLTNLELSPDQTNHISADIRNCSIFATNPPSLA